MRCAGWCLVLLGGFAGPSGAASPQMMDADGVAEVMGGHLPVGPSVTAEQAIAAAYALPAVQAALVYMGSLGYMAQPAYDEAGLAPSVPATFVALAFEKPGLVPPAPGVVGAPMVLIGTVRDAHSRMITTVTGGLAFLDTARETFWTADSLPQHYPGDQSWEVVPIESGDGDGGGLKQPMPTSSREVGMFRFTGGGTNSPEDRKFRSFMACATMGATTALLNTLWQGPPIPHRVVIQGAIRAGLAVISCGAGAYGGGH